MRTKDRFIDIFPLLLATVSMRSSAAIQTVLNESSPVRKMTESNENAKFVVDFLRLCMLLRAIKRTPLQQYIPIARHTKPRAFFSSALKMSEIVPPSSAPPVVVPAPVTKAPGPPAIAKDGKPRGEKKEKKVKGDLIAGMASLELSPQPEYIDSRIIMFEKLFAEQTARIAAEPREIIRITLPDGGVKEATSWETTPFQIALGISKGLAEKTVIAKVSLGCIFRVPSS